nr:hypothetical protein Q903MT_gene1262 [Picea sitchensis]
MGIRDEVQLRDPLFGSRSNGSVSRAWFETIWMGLLRLNPRASGLLDRFQEPICMVR